jgi:hypothetical protein
VMELVHGQTLETVLARQGHLGARECLAVIAQTAAGLSYAHRMGVYHRDIKPSNLMLTDSGTLKIMDFGIARVRGSQRLTRQGSIIGTLAYVAPEQIKGDEGDERSDLYSLACVLYEMLAGAPPFRGDTEYELIRAQVETRPEPLPARPSDLGRDVEPVLMRALAKQPEERFATIAEFSRALGAAAIQGEAADILHGSLLAAAPPPGATKVITTANISVASGRVEAVPSAVPLRPAPSGPAPVAARSTRRPVVLALAGVAVAAVLAVGVLGFHYLSASDKQRALTAATTAHVPAPGEHPAAVTEAAREQSAIEKGPPGTARGGAAAMTAPAASLAVRPPPAPPAAAAPAPVAGVATAAAGQGGSVAAPAVPANVATPAAPANVAAPAAPASVAAPTALANVTTTAAPTNVAAPAAPAPPASAAAPPAPASVVASREEPPSEAPALPANIVPAMGVPLASSRQDRASMEPKSSVSGAISAYSADGWPIIGGQTLRLDGLSTIAADKTQRVAAWVRAHGNYLECEPVGDAYRCLTPQKIDLAQAVLLNGAGRVSPDAGPSYRAAEDQARAARRGVWQ